jgi:hypothetical protein
LSVVVTLLIGLFIGYYAEFVISKILLTFPVFKAFILDFDFGIIPYYFFSRSFLSAAVPYVGKRLSFSSFKTAS